MATCKNCGEELAADSVFCPNCGDRVTHVVMCAFCGMELREGARFCDQCGKSVAESEQKLMEIRGTLTRTLAVAVSSKSGITEISSSALPVPYSDNDYAKYLAMIKSFLSVHLKLDSSHITLDSSFCDLGMDTKDINELLYYLGKTFKISINSFGSQYQFRTVRDVCEYLKMRGV